MQNIRNKFVPANSGANALCTIILDKAMDTCQLVLKLAVQHLVNSSDWTTCQIAMPFGYSLDRLGIDAEHSNAD